MPNRYEYTKIRANTTGNRVYAPTLYPKIEIEDTDIVILTKDGDRLDLLSYRYYKDVSLWWIIAVANGINNGKFAIEPGTELRIPVAIEKILQDLKRINDEF